MSLIIHSGQNGNKREDIRKETEKEEATWKDDIQRGRSRMKEVAIEEVAVKARRKRCQKGDLG
jgi:hypothetical protein